MMNYVIGDDVFGLNVDDIVYVKNGVNGYFGVVVEIRENFPHVTRTIVIYRTYHGDYEKIYASSNCAADSHKGITKIPKDLFGSMILYKEKLHNVLYFDISKPYPLKIENVKTKCSEWVRASNFIHVNWRKDDVEKVRMAETFEEFKDKTYYEMTRGVRIISMCYRSDFENLEKGDRIVLKDIITLDGEARLRLMRVDYKDDGKFNFVHHEVPVNAENYHKCVWNKSNIKLKEAEKTFKGDGFNMNMPFIFDHARLDEILAHDEAKRKLDEKYGFLSLSRPENNITIHSDGVKVTYARCGDLVASSRCHDDDKFDVWTGAKIALERLEKKFIEKAEREKKEKLLNNWYDSLTEEKKEFVKKKLQEEK